MGRRKFTEERKRVNVYLKERLLDRFTLIYFDPARQRADYGALSNVINHLLEEHLKTMEKGKET